LSCTTTCAAGGADSARDAKAPQLRLAATASQLATRHAGERRRQRALAWAGGDGAAESGAGRGIIGMRERSVAFSFS
jgi:hypothetical protein